MDTRYTRPHDRGQGAHAGLARSLGWFSIALGVAEVLAPRAMARMCGMQRQAAGLVRLYGVREIATGIGILRAHNAAPWLWARVGGDVLDVATLAATADKRSVHSLARAGTAMFNVGGVAALDLYAAQNYRRPRKPRPTLHDYSARSGFAQPPDQMRGAALHDFEAQRDMRTPAALRPWNDADAERRAARAAADPIYGTQSVDL